MAACFGSSGSCSGFWYTSKWRRERFVTICKDRDVQSLTWESYMNKVLPRRDPIVRSFSLAFCVLTAA